MHDKNKKLIILNHKVVTALLCALSESEFNRVAMCTLAKEIWDTLKNCYEDTSQGKSQRLVC